MAQGFGDVAERLRRSTVRADGGSGVIWNADGLIVTNAHVARGRRSQVELWDGRRFEGEVTSRDARRDLATIQIQARGLPAAAVGDSSALRPGELVLAVGNPLGFLGALTTGVVHTHNPLWVQAAVRLAPGNSGGPLADAAGRVIAINTMVVSGGLALSIPSNAVVGFLSHGASRVSLGVTVRPVETGLLVLEVSTGSPADAASLLLGDLITGVNGKPIREVADLGRALEAALGGGTLQIQFLRGDRRSQREVTVRLSPRSAAA